MLSFYSEPLREKSTYKMTQSAEMTGGMLLFRSAFSHLGITFWKITAILLHDSGFAAYPSDSGETKHDLNVNKI